MVLHCSTMGLEPASYRTGHDLSFRSLVENFHTDDVYMLQESSRINILLRCSKASRKHAQIKNLVQSCKHLATRQVALNNVIVRIFQ